MNKENLNNFFRLDLSGRYEFKYSDNVKSTIRIGFTNITNKQNIIDSYYLVDNTNQDNIT